MIDSTLISMSFNLYHPDIDLLLCYWIIGMLVMQYGVIYRSFTGYGQTFRDSTLGDLIWTGIILVFMSLAWPWMIMVLRNGD